MRRYWPLVVVLVPLGLLGCFSLQLGMPGVEPFGTSTTSTAAPMAEAVGEVITGIATGSPWTGIIKAVGGLIGAALIGGGAVVAKRRHDEKKAGANNTSKTAKKGK